MRLLPFISVRDRAAYSTLRGVVRRYGCNSNRQHHARSQSPWRTHHLPTLWMVKSGNSVLASSFETDGWTMTSSPFFQFTGVVTRYLSPIWRAVRMRLQMQRLAFYLVRGELGVE